VPCSRAWALAATPPFRPTRSRDQGRRKSGGPPKGATVGQRADRYARKSEIQFRLYRVRKHEHRRSPYPPGASSRNNRHSVRGLRCIPRNLSDASRTSSERVAAARRHDGTESTMMRARLMTTLLTASLWAILFVVVLYSVASASKQFKRMRKGTIRQNCDGRSIALTRSSS
jgi:hypothetical protein